MRTVRASRWAPWALLLAGSLGGCGSLNQNVFELNRHVANAVRPVVGLILLVPEPLRDRVHALLENLHYGDVVVNQLLQGKPELAGRDLVRWVVNSTLGLAGLFDVAKELGYEAHDEDFGQTLAVWGFPEGEYLVLPLVGPSTSRDAAGLLISYFTDPSRYVPSGLAAETLTVVSYADQAVGSRKGQATLASEAIDEYEFAKEAYRQHRRFLIYDGRPPLAGGSDLDAALDALEKETGKDTGKGTGRAGGPGAEAKEGAPTVEGLPGLEDLGAGAPVRSVEDLPGLDDVGPDATESPPAGAATLPGLEESK